MGKAPKSLYVFVSIVFPFIMLILYCEISGLTSIEIKGFAVDNDRNIYVGKEKEIQVFNDKKLIRTIELPYKNGYSFTILNQNIVFAANEKEYIMDLNGNVLEVKNDHLSENNRKLYSLRKEFQLDSNEYYYSTNFLGIYEIKKVVDDDETVIYRIPLFDYIIRVVLFLLFVSFFVFVPIILKKWITY